VTPPASRRAPRALLLASAAALGWTPAGAPAAEHSVRPDGTGDFPTIQAAVDAASAGDEIVLEDGVFSGDGNRDVRFLGKDLVVRSRNGAAACAIDSQGSLASPHRAFRLDAGETAASRIEGLTITGGYVTGPFPENGGAGILVAYGSHPVIADCVFDANEAGFEGFGAGLLAWEGCDITLRDCTFANGVSGWYGGGFTLRKECHALVERCLVVGNTSGHAGGGASITRSNAVLNDCVFLDNETHEGDGGGLLVKAEAMPVLTRCIFAGNRAPWGGALGIGNFPVVTAIDCLFENNVATIGGGAIEVGQDPSAVHLTRCTLVFNQASWGGHLYLAPTATATVETSILGSYCANAAIRSHGAADVDCCVIPGGLASVSSTGTLNWGSSNVDADPRFCAPDPLGCASDPPVSADYRLDASSPAAPASNPCGRVGAYDVGCSATAAAHGVENLPWGRIKAAHRSGP
jgi:predicted outer membrane repeat protein